ncbi:LysR family transcriptional regulator [Thermoflavimicrobium dichotomicum]|uniref:DNA-binding transcriptional regulator, LysR family n=1 Tax=Thermoflavimicrobium dichotomicum TaxID=46223 RepID=A0A1I3LWP2_9BACL|nr:LysR family transcriptional regulator [Thermoflavimicrobium dichotomicum]SFI89149.1 DNA-binding transcriptional regulator, LysR family [Thermoflavimicrobium dichotomicum]
MNLYALRLFVEVAKQQSVSKAASLLSISQPAVTAQIRKLERELGIRLFHPHGRGIRLTDHGQFLLEKSIQLFSLEKQIESELRQILQGESGILRLAATHLPSAIWLPQWMARFKQNHPQATLQLKRGNTEQTLQLLLRYEAELAIIAGSWEHNQIERQLLFTNHWWFVVHPSHPLANRTVDLAELVQYPFIWRETGSSSREKLIEICHNHQVSLPTIGLELNGLFECIQAVKAGYGVFFVPDRAVRSEIANGLLTRVFVQKVHLTQPVCLCRRKDDSLSPLAQKFVTLIQE